MSAETDFPDALSPIPTACYDDGSANANPKSCRNMGGPDLEEPSSYKSATACHEPFYMAFSMSAWYELLGSGSAQAQDHKDPPQLSFAAGVQSVIDSSASDSWPNSSAGVCDPSTLHVPAEEGIDLGYACDGGPEVSSATHCRVEDTEICTRCGKSAVNAFFCSVLLGSIFDTDGKCRHGPFCQRCTQIIDQLTLPSCMCRALISEWKCPDRQRIQAGCLDSFVCVSGSHHDNDDIQDYICPASFVDSSDTDMPDAQCSPRMFNHNAVSFIDHAVEHPWCIEDSRVPTPPLSIAELQVCEEYVTGTYSQQSIFAQPLAVRFYLDSVRVALTNALWA
eukprot:TRINITY_DN47085_c0_g1_i1.p1 TRINITY_DN47085_c0_g1~~TRINITY_DN47085_c0_g1_i1.p1  ORF type:complete len:336 (-),score=31.10 TRINITY_DN47085_c0_g1_i1:81-1088(-)